MDSEKRKDTMRKVKIDFIKHTCSQCGYEVNLVNKDEFYIEDKLGWTFKKGKMLCNICKLKLFITKREKSLTYEI